MSHKPPVPAIFEGTEVPAGALSWRPNERLGCVTDLKLYALMKDRAQAQQPEVAVYTDWLDNHFIIPHLATRAVHAAFDQLELASKAIFKSLPGEEYEDTIRRFEQEQLGMPPHPTSSDGLYWWESNAGGGAGSYPIEYVASEVAMTPAELTAWIREYCPAQEFKIKSDDFLFSVRGPLHTDKFVSVGDIRELSPLGNAVLGAALAAFAIGQQPI